MSDRIELDHPPPFPISLICARTTDHTGFEWGKHVDKRHAAAAARDAGKYYSCGLMNCVRVEPTARRSRARPALAEWA
jgi:hypothetical protein